MVGLLPLLGALAPVFLLVALGLVLARRGLLDGPAEDGLNRLLYWIALPAQLLVTVGRADLGAAFDGPAYAAAVAGFLGTLALAWAVTGGVAPDRRGSVLNAAARANGAFVGLPLVVLLAAAMPPGEGAALAAAYAVLLAGMVPLYNVGAMAAFLLPHHGLGRAGLAGAARELPRNPIVLGCLAGIALALFAPGTLARPPAWAVPGVQALDLLAAAAVPLALLLTGSRLDLGRLGAEGPALAATAAAKLLLAPALTLAAGWVLGAAPMALTAAVILNACPVAMASVAMARQLGGDDRWLAAAIVATTVMSPLTLLGWLWWRLGG
jgi:malonate transporter